jgi:hypothetical protein
MKTVLAATLALSVCVCVGCTRASHDTVDLSDLEAPDREFIEQYRLQPRGGDAAVLVKTPAYVSRNGMLIATGGGRWRIISRNAPGIVTMDNEPVPATPPTKSATPTEAPKQIVEKPIEKPVEQQPAPAAVPDDVPERGTAQPDQIPAGTPNPEGVKP